MVLKTIAVIFLWLWAVGSWQYGGAVATMQTAVPIAATIMAYNPRGLWSKVPGAMAPFGKYAYSGALALVWFTSVGMAGSQLRTGDVSATPTAMTVVQLATPAATATLSPPTPTLTPSPPTPAPPAPAPPTVTTAPTTPPVVGGPGWQNVSAAQFGNDWPLTVPSGTIRCEPGRAVVFDANKRYAVNGTAKDRRLGAEIEEIWAPNPGIPGARKDISPLLNRGLSLCQ